ncbi:MULTISPECIES: energy-coupling factor transporter transmembrane component T family protein [unclassified Corynebacterium]|uniref:energy-coupling factor transporter transmembrane component T family protein n=1 Tax=unclassified Corynebacterium TaxID=2624378 RepID=UPI0030A3C338
MNLLAGTNPVARIIGLMLMTTPLLISIDWVSAAVALAFTIVLSPLCGLGLGALARRAWPILLAAPISGISMLLYGEPGGRIYFEFWLATISDNSISLAFAIMMRVLAVGLPVMVLTANTDPTDLGDGLAQVLKLPAKFVIAAVAGVRLMTLFVNDWHALTRARRARGLGDDGKIRRLFSQVFALLVFALRRSAKLSTAMEARGFGSSVERTWARESSFSTRDWAVIAACVGIAILAIAVAVWTGQFRFLGVS